MLPRSVAVVVSLVVLVLLQWAKPLVFMQVYKMAFNFYPSIMTDYELYKLVWLEVFAGRMAAKVTIPLILGEIVWILVPYFVYKYLVRKS